MDSAMKRLLKEIIEDAQEYMHYRLLHKLFNSDSSMMSFDEFSLFRRTDEYTERERDCDDYTFFEE